MQRVFKNDGVDKMFALVMKCPSREKGYGHVAE